MKKLVYTGSGVALVTPMHKDCLLYTSLFRRELGEVRVPRSNQFLDELISKVLVALR